MNDRDFADILNAVKIIENYEKLWAVCGGWAIDLYLNRITRSHKDVDFAVLRKDQFVIQEYLLSRGWTLEKAVSGGLIPCKRENGLISPSMPFGAGMPRPLPILLNCYSMKWMMSIFTFAENLPLHCRLKK